jgi:uncharacterized alkaline shock family protein YloU
MMNMTEQKQPIGSLKISKDVLATIAGVAAQEIEGVYSLAEAGVADLRGIVRGQLPKAVNVTIGDDIASFDIRLVLENNAKIPVVAQRVQNAVKEAVQSMTGITVSKVNVMVTGVHYETAEVKEEN